MKRPALLFVLLAAFAVAGNAQDLGKIPRPVYFAAAHADVTLDKESAALIAGTPEMLSTSIGALQPFTRVDAAGGARSVLTVTAAPAAGGRIIVTIRLVEAGAVKSENARPFTTPSMDLPAFRAFITESAAKFAPSLDPVEPQADVLKMAPQQQLIRAAQESDYLDQLDKRLELTLWTTGVLRLLDSTGVSSNSASAFGLDILPLIAEADWFFSRELGLQFSFYFNDTNAFDFGSGSRHNAYGVFLFPGVGFVYRTLGTISAQYAITLSAGWIYLTAKAGDVVDQSSTVVLAQGNSTWSNLSVRVRLSPALVWSITPSVALKAGIAFDIVFPGMFPWYTDSPLADFQYLTIGAAYRM